MYTENGFEKINISPARRHFVPFLFLIFFAVFIIALAFLILFYYRKNVNVMPPFNKINKSEGESVKFSEKVLSISDKSLWDSILKDVDWSGSIDAKLLDGRIVPKDEIKEVKVVYTEIPQAYLTQEKAPGEKPFASVGFDFSQSILTLIVHVDPLRLESDAEERDWWITHQVIHALNIIYNPQADFENDIVERDRILFQKYKGKSLWKNL